MDSKPRWQSVDKVYHATEQTGLAHAEMSETFAFHGTNNQRPGSCSLFSCNLWHSSNGEVASSTHEGRPTTSPYASKRVVISSTDVLEHPEDYLIPIKPYEIPATDPDESYRSCGGRTYIEMVYVRRQDVDLSANLTLTPHQRSYLEAWKLKNNPFVQLGSNGLRYRVLHDVWWIILTPYEVPIPDSAILESCEKVSPESARSRWITNSVTVELARNLSVFHV